MESAKQTCRELCLIGSKNDVSILDLMESAKQTKVVKKTREDQLGFQSLI